MTSSLLIANLVASEIFRRACAFKILPAATIGHPAKLDTVTLIVTDSKPRSGV